MSSRLTHSRRTHRCPGLRVLPSLRSMPFALCAARSGRQLRATDGDRGRPVDEPSDPARRSCRAGQVRWAIRSKSRRGADAPKEPASSRPHRSAPAPWGSARDATATPPSMRPFHGRRGPSEVWHEATRRGAARRSRARPALGLVPWRSAGAAFRSFLGRRCETHRATLERVTGARPRRRSARAWVGAARRTARRSNARLALGWGGVPLVPRPAPRDASGRLGEGVDDERGWRPLRNWSAAGPAEPLREADLLRLWERIRPGRAWAEFDKHCLHFSARTPAKRPRRHRSPPAPRGSARVNAGRKVATRAGRK
jgi:hypothetical protein